MKNLLYPAIILLLPVAGIWAQGSGQDQIVATAAGRGRAFVGDRVCAGQPAQQYRVCMDGR